jgi:hypothetical protein
MATILSKALKSVDWTVNVDLLCSNDALAERIQACNMRLAVWGRQIEKTEAGTPSLSFVREMQHAGHHAACLIGLALYKPAAASMRTVLECALYHGYFRVHIAELATLVRDDKYYVSKKEIIDFFNKHQPGFIAVQSKLGFVSHLEAWYSKASAIVHGQIPGAWSKGKGISEFVPDELLAENAILHFEELVMLVQDLFLCTIAQEHWSNFSTEAKKFILKGMPGETKTLLKLDAA